jgi:hypothetical protein
LPYLQIISRQIDADRLLAEFAFAFSHEGEGKACVVNRLLQDTGQEPFKRAQFEHYMFGVELRRGGWSQQDLDEVQRLGSVGFELVTVLPMANGHLLFFKRQIG